MTGTQPTVGDLAEEVVRTDVAIAKDTVTWTKGVRTATAVPFVPTWTQTAPVTRTATTGGMGRTLLAVGTALLVGIGGIATGYIFFGGGQPAPTQVAAGPTPTQPVLATDPPQPTPVATDPPQPTVSPVVTDPPQPTGTVPPTAPPTAPPTVATGLDLLTGLIDLDLTTSYTDEDADPGTPDPAEEPRDAPGWTNLVGGAVGRADLSADDVAALAGAFPALAGAPDRTAVVEDAWPCTDVAVFCGIPQLEPGPYVFVGFGTAEAPPTEGTDGIFSVYYVNTDLDGDWANNNLQTLPRTDNFYLGTQYVIEGGWFGETKGLGQTDFRGPVGPDGQTPRYNERAVSRLVLTQDPPGGFFIIPEAVMGPWFRVASFWQDFSEPGILAVDWVASSERLGQLPTPGRGEPRADLACVRVGLGTRPVGAEPAYFIVTLRFADSVAVDPEATVDVTLLAGTETVEQPDLVLTPGEGGTYTMEVNGRINVPNVFTSVTVEVPGGSLDLTEEFLVKAGPGVNVPAGVAGYAMGDPACGA